MSRQHLNVQPLFGRWKENARKNGIICGMRKRAETRKVGTVRKSILRWGMTLKCPMASQV